MGVSGSGKSTVARLAHERLDWAFAEGDDFHSEESIRKMSEGRPLTDGDRIPWLGRLAAWTRDQDDAGRSTIVSCSALRRAYRDVLRTGGEHTYFVHLTGDKGMILERMAAREHFMPPEMLESQIATLEHLEPDEQGLTVDVDDPPEQVVDRVLAELGFD
ncbi:gluconokinase [Nocardioides coralli]|nr:gluconokinase [Nocardioides coralli]